MHTTESPSAIFDLHTIENIEVWDHNAFWFQYSALFERKGYKLYIPKIASSSDCYTPVSQPAIASGPLPTYAFFSHHDSEDLQTLRVARKVTFAQDRAGRDVAVKLIETGSVEHQIHQRLMSCPEFNNPESFPFVVPTLDILLSPQHNFSFVVMPRWGDGPCVPSFCDVREFLRFLDNILHGLDFLHSRRIVHLDIALGNILINQFTHDSKSGYWDAEARHSLRAEGRILYGLFDFDLSHIFPLDTPVGDCRLPTTSVQGRGAPWLHPKEADDVEQYLDPFKFDVACMGNMLSSNYKVIIPALPLLAPLFDRMTTDNVEDRFTTSQALSFCRFIQTRLTSKELEEKLSPLLALRSDESAKRGLWDSLPADFVAKWRVSGLGWAEAGEY